MRETNGFQRILKKNKTKNKTKQKTNKTNKQKKPREIEEHNLQYFSLKHRITIIVLSP